MRSKSAIIDDLLIEMNSLEKYASDQGYEKGFKEGLEAQISKMTFEEGDIVVIKTDDLSVRALESFRIHLKQFGVKGLIQIKEDSELTKLGEINLRLLGLQRIKS